MASKKIPGTPIPLFKGLAVHVNYKPAKTKRGTNRVWLNIRQITAPTDAQNATRWEVDEALMYVNSADIRFIEVPATSTGPKRRRGR